MVQVVPTIDALRRRRDAILAAVRRRHASRVACSVARGEAGPSSDVDLLVDFDTEASLRVVDSRQRRQPLGGGSGA